MTPLPSPETVRLERQWMRRYALAFRGDIETEHSIGFQLQRVSQGEWKHKAHYDEARRVINGAPYKRYEGNKNLEQAIRCRNRSLGRGAFE